MKAVVVDVKSNYAIALNTKGQFIKIKSKKSFDIGCEVDISPNTGLFTGLYSGTGARIASLAAALLIIFGIGSYSFCYSLPYSYIDIDINPSIEITANMFDKIIKAEPLNKDGAALVTAGNIKNMKIREGINEILKNAVADGYIASDTENTILFTISSKNEKKAAEIQKQLYKDKVAELGMADKNIDVHIDKTTINIHDNARKLGLSPGKLNIIDKLIKVKPELEAEDLIDKSVKDIMKEIKAARKDREEDSDTDSAGSYGSTGNSDGNTNSDGYDDSNDSGDTVKSGGSDSSVDSGDSHGLIYPDNSSNPKSTGNSEKMSKFSKPGNNGQSGKSSEQGNSGESGKPDNSGKTGKSDNSGESGKSDNSGKSGNSGSSGESGKSGNTSKTVKPGNSAKPVKSDNSVKTAKPDNPVKTAKPDNSRESGKSGSSKESGKSGNSGESGKSGVTGNTNKSKDTGSSNK